MRRVLLLSYLILLLIPANTFAQRDSLRNVFLDAESWFLFEEYTEALPLYEGLLQSDPGNNKLKYKIGICLLNNPYQKDRAIRYLIEASNNTNPAYKENSYKERTAPPDALYYLGNAYLVNELLQKAMDTYEQFLEVMDREVYDEELVRAQIRACENARRLKTMPVDIELTLLDSMINTRYSEIRPVISGDGTKMAFVTELPFYDGAFYSEKTDQGWSYPQSITQTLGFDADAYPVALSYDGTEMILYYDDEYIGNLYHSKFEEGRWLPATKLGENISTKFWESSASFSKDGQTLYFTSNRKGTLGGLDIYKSEKQAGGKWGIPVNLGANINSRYNEETPFISEDGKTLYFSSYGHYNMGGYDVFYSKMNDDSTWAEPVNMGYPVNTTDDDLSFQPIDNGFGAYYSLYSPRGMGLHDIYYMDIYSVDNPRNYMVSGVLRTEDGSIDSSKITVSVVDSETGETIAVTSPNEKTGAFSVLLTQGIYELHFKGEGYEDLIKPLQITSGSEKDGINLEDDIELALIHKETLLFIGDESQIQIKDTLYEGAAGEPLIVPLKLVKGSLLVTSIYHDSVLVSQDTLVVEKRRTDLEIIPLPGTSSVELKMVDPDGNIHKNGFTVVGTVPVVVAPVFVAAETEQVVAETEQVVAETDLKLANELSKGSAALLLLKLTENSEGALKEYVENLDLEAEGITTVEDLLYHLQDVSETEGFTMEDVGEAMLASLDQEEIPDYEEMNKALGEKGKQKGGSTILILGVVSGILILIILVWRRRKNKDNRSK